MVKEAKFRATGRRKESVARVELKLGNGDFVVNNRTLENYFVRETSRMLIKYPLIIANVLSKFNISANVSGGGLSGQAGAIAHGISRALLKFDENLRPVLKKASCLTRDPRMKERKKYGQKGARAHFQWTKR
ncbi:MAG: 30S ribosomal protein S9 [Candidatus Omnitrophica bacterium]|nr:30S ribosomal protein S9 [Candidatus Omnitrophota bacterium]